MKAIVTVFLFGLSLISVVSGQIIDSTKAPHDSTFADTTKASIILKQRPSLQMPTMPQLPGMRENKQSIHFDIGSNYRASRPDESTNWDALNKPPDRYDYPFQKQNQPLLIPVTPLIDPQKNFIKPLPLRDYIIPTRAELDILELLWVKDDVQDTTIYSCLDTTINIMMEDLNRLLEGMADKNLVSRKIVSPRNEFNAFGILIEMSPQNRRNRIYEYHTLVNREFMRTFIDANIFLFRQDSSIINHQQLEAARKDSTLLKDLNRKIQRVKNE
jgi:hypothetical protein